MKLQDVMFRDPIRRPGDRAPESFFKADNYELTYEAGMVTVTSAKGTCMVPVSNVKDMTPAPKDLKK